MARVLWVSTNTMTDDQRAALRTKLDDKNLEIIRLRRVVSSDEISWERIISVADTMRCPIVALSKEIHPVEGANYIPDGVQVVYEVDNTKIPGLRKARAKSMTSESKPTTTVSWETLTV